MGFREPGAEVCFPFDTSKIGTVLGRLTSTGTTTRGGPQCGVLAGAPAHLCVSQLAATQTPTCTWLVLLGRLGWQAGAASEPIQTPASQRVGHLTLRGEALLRLEGAGATLVPLGISTADLQGLPADWEVLSLRHADCTWQGCGSNPQRCQAACETGRRHSSNLEGQWREGAEAGSCIGGTLPNWLRCSCGLVRVHHQQPAVIACSPLCCRQLGPFHSRVQHSAHGTACRDTARPPALTLPYGCPQSPAPELLLAELQRLRAEKAATAEEAGDEVANARRAAHKPTQCSGAACLKVLSPAAAAIHAAWDPAAACVGVVKAAASNINRPQHCCIASVTGRHACGDKISEHSGRQS